MDVPKLSGWTGLQAYRWQVGEVASQFVGLLDPKQKAALFLELAEGLLADGEVIRLRDAFGEVDAVLRPAVDAEVKAGHMLKREPASV